MIACGKDRMTSAQLLALVNEYDFRNGGFHLIRRMSYDDGNVSGQISSNVQNMFYERASGDAMKHFRVPGLHARAFACCKDQDSKIAHKS
jgi:hypothetical protein